MTTDPRDAEQARKALHKAEKEYCSNFDKGAVFHWAEKGAYVLKADAQAEIARLTAALAEAEAAEEGALMILVQTQAERDAALAQVAALREVVAFHERLAVDPAALSRRDAQMRAEGMRRALDVVSENADWPEDEHGRTEHPALFARISHAILAAAEKEASNG
jgi:hypothetical protein